MQYPSLTLGEIDRAWQVDGWAFEISRYVPHQSLAFHEHDSAYLSLNLGATFVESSGPLQEDWVEPYGLISHPAGDRHRNRFGPQGSLSLNISCPDPQPLFWRRVTGVRGVLHLSEARELGRRLCTELAWAARWPHLESLVLSELAMALLSLAGGKGKFRAHPQGTRQALEAIQDAPGHAWTLCGLSDLVGLHPNHLARQFHRDTGKTLGQALRQARVLTAARLLVGKLEARPADVAAQCGFADQAHLTRTLNRLLRTTPRKLQQGVPVNLG